MSPRPRQNTDQEILAAAFRAIARLGPAKLTLADVAAEANVTAASLVQRFGSKRDLLLAAAADVANLPDNMEVSITDSANPNAYPISGFTWLLVYENQTDAAKGDAIANLAWWMLHDGQKYATPLDYAALKGVAVKKAEALTKKIKVNNQMVLK